MNGKGIRREWQKEERRMNTPPSRSSNRPPSQPSNRRPKKPSSQQPSRSSSRSLIRIVRPDFEESSQAVSLARRERSDVSEPYVLTLIDNGKPNAKLLLTHAAEELRKRLPLAEVRVHTKQSASAALDVSTADLIAARSRMAISGVGD